MYKGLFIHPLIYWSSHPIIFPILYPSIPLTFHPCWYQTGLPMNGPMFNMLHLIQKHVISFSTSALCPIAMASGCTIYQTFNMHLYVQNHSGCKAIPSILLLSLLLDQCSMYGQITRQSYYIHYIQVTKPVAFSPHQVYFTN